MATKIMRGVCTVAALFSAMLMLTACPGHVKGVDAGVGFDALNTQSKESKENEKWFDSFYGRSKSCETTIWGTQTSCEE